MAPYIGRRMRRVEDERLLTGRGRFAGDIKLGGLVHVAFSRSTLPHALIRSVDKAAASSMPGVLAVWTATDLPEVADGLSDWGPEDMVKRARPVLNRDEVNYVGEAFAVVVAESRYIAQDAAEQVVAELDPLPAVGDVLTATAPGAPLVHADTDSNVARRKTTSYGDIEGAFGQDSVTAKISLKTARVAGAAMEPRAVTATPDEAGGLKVWTSTQNVFGVREAIAAALELEQESVRVLAEDVGGGFGAKGSAFPEEVLTALVAWKLKRPAQWVASRSEDGATTAQAHGSWIDIEIASDRDGKLRGLRGRLVHDMGAYTASGASQPDLIVAHMLSAYVMPAMHVESQVVFTNAVPSGFIRGGGRPLGNYAVERAMDQLARALEISPVELRRRNLVQPEQIPFTTGYPGGRRGLVYDSGDYPRLLSLVTDKVGEVPDRTEDGRVVGVGVACCVESTGFGGGEPARLRLNKDGSAELYVGSTPQGQGHQTMAAQVAADRLGWPIERIHVTAGDTANTPAAELTAGSRSAVQVGNATAKAATAMRRRLLERAGDVLEADAADLVIEDGSITVRGAPSKRVPVAEVVPADGLEVLESFDPKRPLTYSSGCHAAIVAVDPDTGQVEILRYVIAHDTGKAINALIVEGQMHGGYAHGIGYALFESAVYDPDGTFRTPSFLDYTIVSTGEVSATPELLHIETPTDSNAEGFKGAGESGTIPAPAAISGAVEDALRKLKPDVVVDRIPITSDLIVDILSR
jgi:carbon-monoxide dehydrogenase large subunit